MARVNEVFVDVGQSPVQEGGEYDLMSPVTRCSCCPYGFHVDNSFVNYTDTMKRGKHLRNFDPIHGHPIHLAQNRPDLLQHHQDGTAFGDTSGNRDNFAVFGTRTEWLKKKKQRKTGSMDKVHLNLRVGDERLDISTPALSDQIKKSQFPSEPLISGTRHSSGNYDMSLPRQTYEDVCDLKPYPKDSLVYRDPNCPECMNSDACRTNSYVCNIHEPYCHADVPCGTCCSETCCVQSCGCCYRKPSTNESSSNDVFEKVKDPNINDKPFPNPPEAAKVEFDPEKVTEIREYMIKCVNRIHELEDQLRTMPVVQVRVQALREENSTLRRKLNSQKRTIEQLSAKLENEEEQQNKKAKMFNVTSQTESSKTKTKSAQTEIEECPDNVSIPPIEDIPMYMREPPLAMAPAREDFIVPVEKRDVSVDIRPASFHKDIGVGNHIIDTLYSLSPHGLNVDDLPKSFVRRLKSEWEASLPKQPRKHNIGISNTPEVHDMGIEVKDVVMSVGTGSHDIDRLYFVDPYNGTEDELPYELYQRLRSQWESAIPTKPRTTNVAIDAVQPQRNQSVETDIKLESTAVGSHDVATLYYLQPHLLTTDELPIEAIRILRQEWDATIPAPPQMVSRFAQSDVNNTYDQGVETERQRISSIGVGEHDVSRFYIHKSQPFNCENEFPQEILATLKQKWRQEWERSIPPRPKLVSTTTEYHKSQTHKMISTDKSLMSSIGVGDHSVSKVYFLQPGIATEDDISSEFIQSWQSRLRETWIQSLPPKPRLMDSQTEYRHTANHRGVATESASSCSKGIGDHNVDQLYFLQPNHAEESDLPRSYLTTIKSKWEETYTQQIPVKPKLITRATVYDTVSYKTVGTMSEDPQPAMFDEGVEVDLDNEEWSGLGTESWSELYRSCTVVAGGSDSLKAIIEKLHYTYRYEKSEFISLLIRLLARQVHSKACQATTSLSETSTVYENVNSSTVSRGVGDHTIDVTINRPASAVSVGVENRPFLINKFSNTEKPLIRTTSVNTEKNLKDRSVTYLKPDNSSHKGMMTERVATRDVIVWADLIPNPKEDDPLVDKDSWEEIYVYDKDGNIIHTERQYNKLQIPVIEEPIQENKTTKEESQDSRQEGGRYEHYYMSVSDSRTGSVNEDCSSISSTMSIPITRVISGETSTSHTTDFVPKGSATYHPHVHVYGTDPAGTTKQRASTDHQHPSESFQSHSHSSTQHSHVTESFKVENSKSSITHTSEVIGRRDALPIGSRPTADDSIKLSVTGDRNVDGSDKSTTSDISSLPSSRGSSHIDTSVKKYEEVKTGRLQTATMAASHVQTLSSPRETSHIDTSEKAQKESKTERVPTSTGKAGSHVKTLSSPRGASRMDTSLKKPEEIKTERLQTTTKAASHVQTLSSPRGTSHIDTSEKAQKESKTERVLTSTGKSVPIATTTKYSLRSEQSDAKYEKTSVSSEVIKMHSSKTVVGEKTETSVIAGTVLGDKSGKESRPLQTTTWSTPYHEESEAIGSHATGGNITTTTSTSRLLSKTGHVVESSKTTEKNLNISRPAKGAAAGDIGSQSSHEPTTKTLMTDNDEDSTCLTPSKQDPKGETSARTTGHSVQSASARQTVSGPRQFGSRRIEYTSASSKTSSTTEGTGGRSVSTPTSPRSPRSIMKRSSDDDQEIHFNTLPLLRKKKGIRFAKDTKSDSVSSSSCSEDDSSAAEEKTYEVEFVQNLERLRREKSVPNSKILEQYDLSINMRRCCDTIVEWLNDSTKFTSKQMNEAISNLRREWFVATSGRQVEKAQVARYLDAFQNFNPTLLEMIVNLADDNGNTALHYAVSREQWLIVGVLLDTNRIRVNLPNKAGYTPLMLAALCREIDKAHRPTILRLLASGNINQGSSSTSQTALMLAASHGRTPMVQMLLESGADPNRRDREGSTALMCACEHGHMEAAKILLTNSNCDPNIKDNDGSTAFSIALDAKHRDIALMVYAKTNLKESTNHSAKKT